MTQELLEVISLVLHWRIDQTLVNSLHCLLDCGIGGLDCRVITTEYKTRVQVNFRIQYL